MKPTTGLVTWALMNAAASSSAVPPISPISMIASVSGSSWKSRSTSTKLVPLTGSPPMPTQVDWPMPALRELVDDLVGERAAPRDDADRARAGGCGRA